MLSVAGRSTTSVLKKGGEYKLHFGNKLAAFEYNGKKSAFYVIYTIVFLIMALACFSWFIIYGYSLIHEGDGWHQHFIALVYYAKYLRGIIRNLLFEHKLIIPDWDYYIGEGTDIVNAFHYYVIGDPLTLLSVFVPTKYMHYFFSFLAVFRLYLSGLSFSALCFGTGIKNRYGILTGAIAYSFSCWALVSVANHPYFINPMIYFPLMILGIEKIISGKKPYLFIIIAAISAASNFYFFYIIAMLAILYAVIRLVLLYRKNIKKGILTLLRMGGMAVIGVCIAAIILLPVLMLFINDSRLSVKQRFQSFYPLFYYRQLPSIVISDATPYWLCIGLSAPVIIAVFLLFFKKNKDSLLKILFILCILVILLPIGGRFLNGMSYKANRWSWAFSLLCTYILAREWEAFRTITIKEWNFMMGSSVVLYLLCLFFKQSRKVNAFAALPLIFCTLIVIKKNPSDKKSSIRQQLLLLLLVAGGAFNLAYNRYSPTADSYIIYCKEYRSVWSEWADNEAAALKETVGESFTRMTGDWLNLNANIMNKVSSTQYYWTISNSYLNKFRTDMYIREPQFFNYRGYDERTSLLALSAVQYYMADANGVMRIPYGYSLFEEHQGYNVYKNDFALPIAYCYDEYMKKDQWDLLNPVQKQEAQMEAAVIETDLAEVEEAKFENPDYIVPYNLEYMSDSITQSEDGIITTSADAQIELTLQQDVRNAEIYIAVEGLEFIPTQKYELYFGDESVDPLDLYNEEDFYDLEKKQQITIKSQKQNWDPIQDVTIKAESSTGLNNKITYLQPETSFSGGRHDFITNLGYSEETVSKITLTFPTTGRYSFDNLRVYSIPMGSYRSRIAKLKKNTLQNVQFATDTISGEISLKEPKILCLAIPYSTGWKAFIDDEKTQVLCLNERYMGILIPAGDHNIRFQYSMPYKKAGMVISLIGLVGFIVLIVFSEQKRNGKN